MAMHNFSNAAPGAPHNNNNNNNNNNNSSSSSINNNGHNTECKESHFYRLPFGRAQASFQLAPKTF